MVQGDDKHLSSLLHQGLPVVGEEQVVVGDPVAHRVIGTHGVEERGEERQCVSAGESRAGLRDAPLRTHLRPQKELLSYWAPDWNLGGRSSSLSFPE